MNQQSADPLGEPAFDGEGPQTPLLSPEERRAIRILVVDDEPSILESCESVLTAEGYECNVERRAEDALRRIKAETFQIVLIDQNMPQIHGLELVGEVQRRLPDGLAIVMTGHATTEDGVQAIQAGAWDYLPKPFTATQLLVLVGRAAVILRRAAKIDRPREREGLLTERGSEILGVSRVMRQAVTMALKVAPTDASVFITGESGTGKELFAQYIHRESRRSRRGFVAVNCAALPGELLESEMFGHRKGSFTGAIRDKAGLLEMADGGTFFLDELAEMPVSLQPKLLRVLQDGVLRRVGSEKDDAVVDVRFISATNRDPERALEEGQLRRDLYYRLRVVPIHLPALRDRTEDIPVLIRHFVEHFWRRHRLPGKEPPSLAPETLKKLIQYPWPGNVRELQNVIENLVVLADPGKEIGPDRLWVLETPIDGPGSSDVFTASIDLHQSFHEAKQAVIDRFEREYLAHLIARTEGNMSESARQAGVDRTTLYRLMDKHKLAREAFV
ncbi:MAG: sigma-54 dependent transcriptional regulator [Gemmatimonadota bacterium]|nr:sigma-54 dependent transcriptional regulator [Gemmatimonadota bacterium]